MIFNKLETQPGLPMSSVVQGTDHVASPGPRDPTVLPDGHARRARPRNSRQGCIPTAHRCTPRDGRRLTVPAALMPARRVCRLPCCTPVSRRLPRRHLGLRPTARNCAGRTDHHAGALLPVHKYQACTCRATAATQTRAPANVSRLPNDTTIAAFSRAWVFTRHFHPYIGAGPLRGLPGQCPSMI